MRIPLKAAYRAAPALDRFTPEQCRLFNKRLWKEGPYAGTSVVVALVTFTATLLLMIGLAAWIYITLATGSWMELIFESPLIYLIVAGLIAMVAGVPLIATLVASDLTYRHFLPKVLAAHGRRLRCLRCEYSLLGQVPTNDKLRCPECGRETTFAELGVKSETEWAMTRAVAEGTTSHP